MWELLKNEWVIYGGKILYEESNIVVIEGSSEFLVIYNNTIVHLLNDRIAVKTYHSPKWHVTTAPRFRGTALKIALDIIKRLPPAIRQHITTSLPLLAPL